MWTKGQMEYIPYFSLVQQSLSLLTAARFICCPRFCSQGGLRWGVISSNKLGKWEDFNMDINLFWIICMPLQRLGAFINQSKWLHGWQIFHICIYNLIVVEKEVLEQKVNLWLSFITGNLPLTSLEPGFSLSFGIWEEKSLRETERLRGLGSNIMHLQSCFTHRSQSMSQNRY